MFGNYYNPYPMNYQQPTYQPQQQTQQSTQPVDDRTFVPSEAAAEAYLVAPNNSVRLWHSSKPIFYEKYADMNGRQFPMRKFEYRELQQTETQQTDIEARLKAIEDRLNAFENREATPNE